MAKDNLDDAAKKMVNARLLGVDLPAEEESAFFERLIESANLRRELRVGGIHVISRVNETMELCPFGADDLEKALRTFAARNKGLVFAVVGRRE